MQYLATCKMGLESLVTRELRKLNIEVDETLDARVFFSGKEEELFRSLLWLRCAERVLMVVGKFHAETFEELYQGIYGIEWKNYLKKNSFIHVNGKSAKSRLFSVTDCQSITKKAIVEKLRASASYDILPENGEEIIIEIGILKDEVTVCLDASGAGLSRRGYRTYNVAAPISETLGAGIVSLTRFHDTELLVDPMCGSGTMPIEAAMIAQNIAPGLNRTFSAEKWHFFDSSIMQRERNNALDSRNNVSLNIFGYDIDSRCIDLCKKHAKKAGVMVNWKVQALKDFSKLCDNGIIVCNPPYGERLLERKDVENLYREMRIKFSDLGKWSINIITAYKDFEKIYGKVADKRRKLSNGGMSCQLYQYFRTN